MELLLPFIISPSAMIRYFPLGETWIPPILGPFSTSSIFFPRLGDKVKSTGVSLNSGSAINWAENSLSLSFVCKLFTMMECFPGTHCRVHSWLRLRFPYGLYKWFFSLHPRNFGIPVKWKLQFSAHPLRVFRVNGIQSNCRNGTFILRDNNVIIHGCSFPS